MTVFATEGQYAHLSALIKFSDTPEYLAFHNKLVTAYEAATPTYSIGTVLGAFIGTPTATAAATVGTGNGVMGAITMTAANGLKLGTYTLKITKTVANAGDFVLINPDGAVVGQGQVATAFAQAGFAFTLADGATDFIAGDSIAITVAGTVKYKVAVETATDGSKVPAAIYIADAFGASKDTVMVATTDTKVLTLNRGKIIVSKEALRLDATYDSAAKLQAAYDALAALGILVEASN